METKKEVSKKVSNVDLSADLKDLNVEALIAKSAKNRSIWKAKFKSEYSDNEKTARRKIRSEQLRLSKALLHSIITKQETAEVKKSAESLFVFYSKGLEIFADYTNVSANENPDKRKILDLAYNKMKQVKNM